jgi:hypothetical protein
MSLHNPERTKANRQRTQAEPDVRQWGEPPRNSGETKTLLWGLTPDEFDRVRADELSVAQAWEIVAERKQQWRDAR